MSTGQRRPPGITTRDIHEYLNRRSELCDSSIKNAYTKLSHIHTQDKLSASAGFHSSERRHSISSSKHVKINDAVRRPSSAQERQPKRAVPTGSADLKPRGILKKPQSQNTQSTSNRDIESPDAWFQRIMHVKKLSPLDLCEVFSFGDTRKHPLVSLSHVCEVLFDLDPESANGSDPVTEEMEDFLFQFASEEHGKIVVNIREALRSLDIWQSRVVSSTARVAPSKLASDLQSKAVVLESKNRKLKDAISSLQDANLRLSQQLDAAAHFASGQPPDTLAPAAWSPRSRSTLSPSKVEVSPVKIPDPTKAPGFSSALSLIKPTSPASTLARVVDLHEKELVEIATKLQYTGVERLEKLLKAGDKNSTGFVSLKQLCWMLLNDFQLQVSEVRLIEVCMGMNFNSQAQLDYTEFLDALLDILIYALPNIRESAKQKSLIRFDQYLQSGFPLGRDNVRQLLDALCSKHDRQNDQCILLPELIHALRVDLVKLHGLELPFPLDEQEIIQLVQPFIQRTPKSASGGFIFYPELLDAILGPFPINLDPVRISDKQSKRALKWGFWRGIQFVLSGSDQLLENKVLAQLSKILAKVDPDSTFLISRKHFRRIFEERLSSDDMTVLEEVLSMLESTKPTAVNDTGNGSQLRYDVLLKLIFGSPQLNDEDFFESNIKVKLLHEQERVCAYVSELMTTRGAAHKLEILDFHNVFIVQAEVHPLVMTAMLFLFAAIDESHEGCVRVKALRDFLSRTCWKGPRSNIFSTSNANGDTRESAAVDVNDLKKLVAECCAAYDLETALENHARCSQGWISQEATVSELEKMFHQLGVVGVKRGDLENLAQSLTKQSAIASTSQNARSIVRGAIHYDTFFDVLYDWISMIQAMGLPHSLVETKKAFENFDCERVGLIRCQDWNKAWRIMCRRHKIMSDWEIRVLHRRFLGRRQERERDRTIDYACLLVYLLDYQQRKERKCLQKRAMEVIKQKLATRHPMSTDAMKRIFRSFDTDNKGYFNVDDLKRFLASELGNANSSDDDQMTTLTLLDNPDALASVMSRLTGHTRDLSSTPPNVVTFERFRDLANSLPSSCLSKVSISTLASVEPTQSRRSLEESFNDIEHQAVSSLRAFEINILQIVSEFADSKGNILPSRAFRYLSLGPISTDRGGAIQSRLVSPPRTSTIGSPTNRSPKFSVSTRRQERELGELTLDPLTPGRLKQLLEIYYRLEVSTHLVSQFFLHIGSPSKYFLDLPHFAQWVAPLSVELQMKAREIIRQMIVKGKGGGGKVDLDRFLAQLHRRLQNSPRYMASIGSPDNTLLQFVPASLLLTTLHQLNIPLHKQELLALLRHFGMEDDLEVVDYSLFLQRLYELNAWMTHS